jgi:glutathione S-transferase
VAFGLEERQAAYEKAKPFMQRFENVLSKQKWIAGKHLSYADFYLYEVFILFLGLYGAEELAKF